MCHAAAHDIHTALDKRVPEAKAQPAPEPGAQRRFSLSAVKKMFGKAAAFRTARAKTPETPASAISASAASPAR
jgi:hypothetical protein